MTCFASDLAQNYLQMFSRRSDSKYQSRYILKHLQYKRATFAVWKTFQIPERSYTMWKFCFGRISGARGCSKLSLRNLAVVNWERTILSCMVALYKSESLDPSRTLKLIPTVVLQIIVEREKMQPPTMDGKSWPRKLCWNWKLGIRMMRCWGILNYTISIITFVNHQTPYIPCLKKLAPVTCIFTYAKRSSWWQKITVCAVLLYHRIFECTGSKEPVVLEIWFNILMTTSKS